MTTDQPPRIRPTRFAAAVCAALVPLTATACAAPGSGNASLAPARVVQVSTDLGTGPVKLTLYDGAGLKKIDDALIAAFTRQHPNVTITARYDPDDVQAVNAPRVIASTDPPDV